MTSVVLNKSSTTSKVQRSDLDVTTKGKSVISKIMGSTTISMISTGADAGTGDVTLALPETGIMPGQYNSLVVDKYGRAVSGTSYSTSYQLSNSKLTSISNLSSSMIGFIKLTNGVATLETGAGAGTVTSVTLSMPSLFTITNPTIDTSGTISVQWGGSNASLVAADGSTVLISSLQAASTLLSSISKLSTSASGYLYFTNGSASLASVATQTVTLTGAVTGSGVGTIETSFAGTVSVSNGGTGISAYEIGDLLTASSTGAFSRLSIGTSGYVLVSNGASKLPSWTDLSTSFASVSGASTITTVGTIKTGIWHGTVLETAYGGTGASLTPNIGDLLYADSTSTFALLHPGSTAGVLYWSGTGWSLNASSGAVKYNSSDTSGYLSNKIAPGTGIVFSIASDSAYGTVLSINSIEQSWRLTSYPAASYSVQDTDDTIIVNASAGTPTVSIMLPNPSLSYDGRIFTIRNARASGTTLVTSSGILYNASSSVSSISLTLYNSIELQCVRINSTDYAWIAK